jgi:hypothetical protein
VFDRLFVPMEREVEGLPKMDDKDGNPHEPDVVANLLDVSSYISTAFPLYPMALIPLSLCYRFLLSVHITLQNACLSFPCLP